MSTIADIIVAAETALSAGATTALTVVGKAAVTDAYNGLKSLIQKQFGTEHVIVTAMDDLAAHPNSAGRHGTLTEEWAAAKADQIPELIAAVQALLDALQETGNPPTVSQSIVGDHNIQIGNGSSININSPRT